MARSGVIGAHIKPLCFGIVSRFFSFSEMGFGLAHVFVDVRVLRRGGAFVVGPPPLSWLGGALTSYSAPGRPSERL